MYGKVFRSLFIGVFMLLVLGSGFAGQDGLVNRKSSFFGFESTLEVGFVGFPYNTIKLGSNGTYFDYVNEGGLSVYFPFNRLSGDIILGDVHKIVLLIQPLDVSSRVKLGRDIRVDEILFPAGTVVDLRYGFDFYRLSYLYDFLPDPRNELAAGLSLQIRNATIIFADTAGTLLADNRNVGPVPILKFRAKGYLADNFWLGTEIDGFYASGRYITGSENEFEGAILDASLRAGFSPVNFMDVFLNFRYVGGGAVGTQEAEGPLTGYTWNWLSATSVSVGVTVR